jgi:hypothetical protein
MILIFFDILPPPIGATPEVTAVSTDNEAESSIPYKAFQRTRAARKPRIGEPLNAE